MSVMPLRPELAHRMANIAPFEVMEVLAAARRLEDEGRDVIHLEVGEPDFPTPEPVLRAAQAALATKPMFYTSALGMPELRQGISDWYASTFGAEVPLERIVVTSGSSAALLMALGALFNPGDRVLMADPGYPCNRNFVRFLDAEPVLVASGPGDRYQLTAPLARAAWGPGVRGAIAASPSNPTGTCLSATEWIALCEVCRDHEGALIADEIYQGLVYDGPPETVLSVADDVWVVNSFSKYFQMTGWRLGWLVAPEGCTRDIEKVAQNLYISASTPAQYAALAALQPEGLAVLEARRAELAARRDVLLAELPKIGFAVRARPQGAFYIYCDVSQFTDDSFGFAAWLLEQTGVALTPGRDFGEAAPDQHVRIAYTQPVDRLREAVERIGTALARLSTRA
jgi:aspartate/methionine/tyrosine aminotransferase